MQVTAMWIVIGLGLAAVIVAILATVQRRDYKPDLGVVSSQWIAEQRSSQANDPQS